MNRRYISRVLYTWGQALFIALSFVAPTTAQQPTDTIATIQLPADFIFPADTSGWPAYPGQRPGPFPSLASLFAAVDSFYAAQCAAERKEFQDSKKGRWLAWLPTVGASFVPSFEPGRPTRLRPTLSYSLGNVEQNIRQSEAQKAKRRAIEDRSRLDAQRTKEEIWKLYQRRILLLEQLQHQEEVFAIDTRLFEFYTTQFREVKIPADFYLGEQRKYLDKKFALHQARLQIRMLEIELLTTAHATAYY